MEQDPALRMSEPFAERVTCPACGTKQDLPSVPTRNPSCDICDAPLTAEASTLPAGKAELSLSSSAGLGVYTVESPKE